MNRKLHKYIGEGVVAAALLCGISSAFADTSSDRLATYKANRLIPQEFSLIKNNSDEDVAFSKSSLSWNTSGAIAQALKGELAKMNAQELLDFIKAKEGGQTALDYLAALADGSETSTNITAEEAKADILALFALHCYYGSVTLNAPGGCPWDGVLDVTSVDIGQHGWWEVNLGKFKMTPTQIAAQSGYQDVSGLNDKLAQLSGDEPWLVKNLRGVDMTNIPNFTAEKLASMEYIENCKLPTSLVFTGNEDLSNLTFMSSDFSGCSGMTGSQFLQASFMDCKLPEVTFSGSENFSSVDLSGRDVSTCTGITSEQIRQAVHPYTYTTNPFDGMKMTSAQFNAWKDTLAGAVWRYTTTTVYVDGVATEIEGTYYENF